MKASLSSIGLFCAVTTGLALAGGTGCGDGDVPSGQAQSSGGSSGEGGSSEPAGAAGSSGSTQAGSVNSGGAAGAPGGTSGGGAGGACEDVYPDYGDGYTCEEQAGWGKCDETWLQGYCNLSCNRCGDAPPAEGGAHAGLRNVEFPAGAAGLPNFPDLAVTPPMGWNSWNTFGCEKVSQGGISEDLIKEIASAMVESGMRDVGYEYINIDDCWQASKRSDEGAIVPDPERFPNGMAALSEFIHGQGLKLGVYSDRGTATCAGYPGSYNHEIQDAQTYADWGIDYLKYDNCAHAAGRQNDPEMQEDYTIMRDALRLTGRPIVYSICAWWFQPWMPEVGHLWRTTTDIRDEWDGSKKSVTSLLNWSGGDTTRYGTFSEDNYLSGAYVAPGLAQYAGPDTGWNDPDMLEVGNGGMTDTQYRSHFSLWALMAAPLIAGNDLREMDEATIEILTNDEVIAVNQDPLGIQGTPISESTTLEVWAKQLSEENSYAVILFNRTDKDAEITVEWSSLGLSETATVRDLWDRADLGEIETGYTAVVESYGVVMLRVLGQ